MADSASGFAFRMRSRNTASGMGSTPPMPVPPEAAHPPAAPAAVPDNPAGSGPLQIPPDMPAGMLPPEPLTAQLPPKPMAPPPPTEAQLAQEAAERAKGRLRLREEVPPPKPAATVPIPENVPPPPPFRAQGQGPAGPVAIDKQVRPEDSRAFRWGVKFVSLIGLLAVLALGAIAWHFIKNREEAPSPANPVAAAKAVLQSVRPADAPTPEPTPVPTPVARASVAANPTAFLEEVVGRMGISGVAAGARPRAMINGVLYRPGQEIDGAQGVILQDIDSKTRTLTFEDPAGNRLTRRF